ncbi:hypothetical protein [Ligilactobacillus aviarius]|uniref:hypothetical protein n=1 Tax=Ligilactobacillus aviarius TaxID=1606 RepID=UPI00249D973B|nr:hypothetical protein [Ligilactobacillus aviarius]
MFNILIILIILTILISFLLLRIFLKNECRFLHGSSKRDLKNRKHYIAFSIFIYCINYFSIILVAFFSLNFNKSGGYILQNLLISLSIYFVILSLLNLFRFKNRIDGDVNHHLFPALTYFSSKLSEIISLLVGVTTLLANTLSIKIDNTVINGIYTFTLVPFFPISFSLDIINSFKIEDDIEKRLYITSMLIPIILLSIPILILKFNILNHLPHNPILIILFLIYFGIMSSHYSSKKDSTFVILSLFLFNFFAILYPAFDSPTINRLQLSKSFIIQLGIMLLISLLLNVFSIKRLSLKKETIDRIACYLKNTIKFLVFLPTFTLLVNEVYNHATISKNYKLIIAYCITIVPAYLIYVIFDYLKTKNKS